MLSDDQADCRRLRLNRNFPAPTPRRRDRPKAIASQAAPQANGDQSTYAPLSAAVGRDTRPRYVQCERAGRPRRRSGRGAGAEGRTAGAEGGERHATPPPAPPGPPARTAEPARAAEPDGPNLAIGLRAQRASVFVKQ